MGGLHSLCQEADSGADGILVGLVRAEPGSPTLGTLGTLGTRALCGLGTGGGGGIIGKELRGVEDEEEETEEKEGILCAFQALGQAACEVSWEVGGWRDGSEGEDEREEVERALEGVKVEKTWASKPSAGEEVLWKLWGLRGAETGTDPALGWNILGSAGG